jgi:hypothetical protein
MVAGSFAITITIRDLERHYIGEAYGIWFIQKNSQKFVGKIKSKVGW